MPTIETTTWINCPLEKVYAISKDNRSFPEFMKDVKSLDIVEEEGDRIVSDWVGIIPTFGIKMRWRQEDVWDDAAHTCKFRQVSGDFDSMDGDWLFSEEKGGTRFDSKLEYGYTVPTLGPLVKKVIHSIVTKNMENLLESIKVRCES
ncbi:MAG TPA: SRPBCC family protein [Fimbriimonadaceae bacterium]|jgi:ribosome-associated toxin RatA of RatAB toxin-antitoxin module